MFGWRTSDKFVTVSSLKVHQSIVEPCHRFDGNEISDFLTKMCDLQLSVTQTIFCGTTCFVHFTSNVFAKGQLSQMGNVFVQNSFEILAACLISVQLAAFHLHRHMFVILFLWSHTHLMKQWQLHALLTDSGHTQI